MYSMQQRQIYPGNQPQQMQQPPGMMHSAGTQGQMYQRFPISGQQNQVPGQMQQFPGQMQQFPGQMQQFPGQMQPFPGQMQPFPGQMQTFQGQRQQFPGQMQQFPGQMQQFPGQTQQFPGQMQQFPRQQMVGPSGTGTPTPPAYDPQMTKEFLAKQEKMKQHQMKEMEKQRQKMEQQMKQRQFQETQKRLKEFSALGGRKTDVDKAIHSIIGSTAAGSAHRSSAVNMPHRHATPYSQAPPSFQGGIPATHHVPHQVPANQTTAISSTNQIAGDDFADFKAAPAADDFEEFKSAPGVTNVGQRHSVMSSQGQSQSVMSSHDPEHSVVSSQGQGQGHSVTSTHTSPPGTQPEMKEEALSMMMAKFSDLSAEAGGKRQQRFKPSVKDVAVTQHKAEVFSASTRARHWSYSEQEALTGLFTIPAQPAASQLHPPQPCPPFPVHAHPHSGQVSPGKGASHIAPIYPNQNPASQASLMGPISAMGPVSSSHIPASQAAAVAQNVARGLHSPRCQTSPPSQQQQFVSQAQTVPPAAAVGRWWEEGSGCVLPPVYGMVLEACVREGNIDTHTVYAILLRSGLERATLGLL